MGEMTLPHVRNKANEPEPRWPGLVALAAGAALHYALPPRLSYGPDWGLPALMAVLMIPILASHRKGLNDVARWLTFVALGALTAATVVSVVLLVLGVLHKQDQPLIVLRSAAVLWLTNVLVFAVWYWKLDAGGPLGRDARTTELDSAFLFPQLTRQPVDHNWSPEFLDYLFIAFNTSTAFSPTDTPVLCGWAKALTMLQSVVSLTVLVVLAARAINVL